MMPHPSRDPSLTHPTAVHLSGLHNLTTFPPHSTSSRSFSSLPFRNRQTTEISLATSPFPSQEILSNLVDGQFSDADSDQDPIPPEPKRQRLDAHSRLNNQGSQIPRFQNASLSHRPLPLSVSKSSNSNPSTTSLPLAAVRDPSICTTKPVHPMITQNPAKLPSSLHRLHTLMGIQDSSKAIIKSTSPSLPLGPAPNQAQRASRIVNDACSHNGPALVEGNLLGQSSSSIIPDHYLRALTGFQSELGSINTIPEGTALVRSSRPQATFANRWLRNYGEHGSHPQQTEPFRPDSRGKDQPSETSCNPTSLTTNSGNALNNAHLSPALFDHLGPALCPSDNITISDPDIDPILVAPKFTQSTSEPGGFAMPARGTFSIPAPTSFAELQALHSGSPLTTQLPDSNHLYTANSIASLSSSVSRTPREASPPSARQLVHPGDHKLTVNDAFEESTPSEAITKSPRKRKARVTKKKAKVSDDQMEDPEQEVELVKPPPTINGKVSHGRKVPPGYVKRTPNSFIMFRSHVIANKLLPPGIENDNRQISRIVSGLWAGLSEDDLKTWQTASRELRVAARAKNPDLKNPPINKRKTIVRRKRSGQLPGETSEQRVEREKARAAALAKVIIDARGERLDKEKLVELAGICSVLDKPIETLSSRARDPATSSRDASRPEFRAPASIGSIAASECAESTLTTSPYPNSHRMLTPMLEHVTEDPLNSPTSLPVNLRSAGEKKNNKTKRTSNLIRKAPASSTSKLPSDSNTTKLSSQLGSCKKPVPSAAVNPDISSSLIFDHLPTKESLPQSALVVSRSMEQSNAIDLAAFSSLFESLPESSTTFSSCYAQQDDNDRFQSLGPNVSKTKPTPPIITESSSSPSDKTNTKTIAIDPSILTMTSVPIETAKETTIIPSEPTTTASSGFWSTSTPMILNPQQDEGLLCSPTFIINGSTDDYSLTFPSSRGTDQATITTDHHHHHHQQQQHQQQAGEFLPQLDLLTQFQPCTNQQQLDDLGHLLISQQYSSNSQHDHHSNHSNHSNHHHNSHEFINFESLYFDNHHHHHQHHQQNGHVSNPATHFHNVDSSSELVTEEGTLLESQSHHHHQQQQQQQPQPQPQKQPQEEGGEENNPIQKNLDDHRLHQHHQSSVFDDDDHSGKFLLKNWTWPD